MLFAICHPSISPEAQIEAAVLMRAQLQGADFSGANVIAADFRGAAVWITAPPGS